MLSICIISAEKSILVFSFRFPSFSLYLHHTAVLSEIKIFLLLLRLTAVCVAVPYGAILPKSFLHLFLRCSVFTKIDAIAVPKNHVIAQKFNKKFIFVNFAVLFCKYFVQI